MKKIVTISSVQTKKIGQDFARKIKSGGVICLTGDLGAGKTTFAQGFLKALGVKGPYTSPTFLVMKRYRINPRHSQRKTRKEKSLRVMSYELGDIYHIDAYRIKDKDLLNLGWKEIIADPKNIVVIEWADRVKKIVPKNSLWINFEWLDEKKRRIILS